MPRAICEDCGSLVEAELTHNGICAVGHYVHCGWGHELSPDDLISDDVAQIIEALEAKLAQAVEGLRDLTKAFTEKVDVEQTRWKMPYEHPLSAYDRAVAFLKGESHE